MFCSCIVSVACTVSSRYEPAADSHSRPSHLLRNQKRRSITPAVQARVFQATNEGGKVFTLSNRAPFLATTLVPVAYFKARLRISFAPSPSVIALLYGLISSVSGLYFIAWRPFDSATHGPALSRFLQCEGIKASGTIVLHNARRKTLQIYVDLNSGSRCFTGPNFSALHCLIVPPLSAVPSAPRTGMAILRTGRILQFLIASILFDLCLGSFKAMRAATYESSLSPRLINNTDNAVPGGSPFTYVDDPANDLFKFDTLTMNPGTCYM